MSSSKINNGEVSDFFTTQQNELKLHEGCANEDNAIVSVIEKDFKLFHSIDEQVTNSNFKLHTHDNFMEVLVFLKGDANFHIEGNVYQLESGDIVIAQPSELHRVVHRSNGYYERIVLFINTRFFSRNDCEYLKNVFINRKFGEFNLISHDSPENLELLEIIKRIEKYASISNPNSLIIKNALIEFLYVLNLQNRTTENNPLFDNNIRNIVMHLNEHLIEDLDLEDIASEFFMSKYHLCRIFKKSTGFTVNQYITHKRLSRAKELYENGISLSDAASKSGFKSYSNFYRAYVKEMGEPPKRNLKNQI